jgi:hypothetical protein
MAASFSSLKFDIEWQQIKKYIRIICFDDEMSTAKVDVW